MGLVLRLRSGVGIAMAHQEIDVALCVVHNVFFWTDQSFLRCWSIIAYSRILADGKICLHAGKWTILCFFGFWLPLRPLNVAKNPIFPFLYIRFYDSRKSDVQILRYFAFGWRVRLKGVAKTANRAYWCIPPICRKNKGVQKKRKACFCTSCCFPTLFSPANRRSGVWRLRS